tara:strand:- start:2373 stop:3173 length:801 start_codon:yes stop_codon:yes gene_type:complete
MKGGKLNLQKGRSYNQSQKELNKSTSNTFNQHNVNATRLGLKQLQQRLAITTTSADITGTVTSIGIVATGFATIKRNDELLIVNPVTGASSEVKTDNDVKITDNYISVLSVTLYAPSGSFILFKQSFLNYFIRGGTITYKTTILNAAYKTLGTTPVQLVAGVAGMVMIPINLLIIVGGHVAIRETNNRTLYCAHGTSGAPRNYWDSIRGFNFGMRSNSTWNMRGISGCIFETASVKDLGINLFASGDFANNDYSLNVYLTYRIDSA